MNTFCLASTAQSKIKFSCPVKNGGYYINKDNNSDSYNPIKGLRFYSKENKFYSATSGIVKDIDTVSGVIVVTFNTYQLAYMNTENIIVNKNKVVKKGEFLGTFKGEQLLIIVSRKGDVLDSKTLHRLFFCK